MQALIEKPGLLDTIQDAGRFHLGHWGIGSSGPMDWYAFQMANALVGNHAGQAVLEMHHPAAIIRFIQPAIIAITGADFSATINQQKLGLNRTHLVPADSVLQFGHRMQGSRTYLSVCGGWQLPEVLGSCSTSLSNHLGGGILKRGEGLNFIPAGIPSLVGVETLPLVARNLLVDEPVPVLPGPDWKSFPAETRNQLIDQTLEVLPASNRMAIRLSGPVFSAANEPMISIPVLAGTVQWLPEGDLLVLMADHQTVGGYPRVWQVAMAALPQLAQSVPGRKLKFALTTMDEACERLNALKRQIFNLQWAARQQIHERINGIRS
jgi:antagonist of KipI